MRGLVPLVLFALLLPSTALAAPVCHGFNTLCVRETNRGSECEEAGADGFHRTDVYVGVTRFHGTRTCNAIQTGRSTEANSIAHNVYWSNASTSSSYHEYIAVTVGTFYLTPAFYDVAYVQWYSAYYGSTSCYMAAGSGTADVRHSVGCPLGPPPSHPDVGYGRILP